MLGATLLSSMEEFPLDFVELVGRREMAYLRIYGRAQGEAAHSKGTLCTLPLTGGSEV